MKKSEKDSIRQKAINELRKMAGKIQLDDMQEEQKAVDKRRQDLLDKLAMEEDIA